MFWGRFDHGSRMVLMKLQKYSRGKRKKDEIFIITSNSVGVH